MSGFVQYVVMPGLLLWAGIMTFRHTRLLLRELRNG